MKRNIVIVVAGILLLIMLSLFYTYAINVSMDEISGSADLTYNVNLSDQETTTITVEAGKTKYFDLFITNTNDATINYGLVYNNVKTSGITVAQLNESKNAASDLIDSNTTYQISLIIKNDTQSSITYDILPVVGYVNGGDLVVPSNHTLITDVYNYKSNSVSGTVSDWINVNGSGSVLGPEASGLDTSGANSPDLLDGLIPVMYDGSKWVKADSANKNETYKWYDYNNKQWANAVLVSSTNRENYKTADAGTPFNDSDILAYYVWIPRYKYKVWNITKTIGTDSYNAETTGIDIVFEKEKATTGTIRCNYDFTITDGSLSEICSGSNGEYYTHPAFTFGSDELRGIWVGKYEVSNTTSNIRIKENLTSIINIDVTTFSRSIQSMSASSNEYGLNNTTTDSHMMKNMEWGAVAYLTNSDYGRCSDGECSEVSINSTYSAKEIIPVVITGAPYGLYSITGCGPQSTTSTSYGITCNAYNTELGQLASTTGNVYGVYDMSGGAEEYVMGNMSSAAGSYTYYASSGGSNFSYSETTAKYIDIYANGSSYNNQIAYNRAMLGDATGELVASNNSGWNNDYARFLYSSFSWFVRGGDYAVGASAGVFYFDFMNDSSGAASHSARACLVDVA